MPKVQKVAVGDPAEQRGQPAEMGIEPSSQTIIDRAVRWIAKDREVAALQRRWQMLETALFHQAVRLKLDCEALSNSDVSEACQMRALDAEIARGLRHLQEEAREIRRLKATTIAAAIAKVELGLKVQGQFDWRADALELAEDGIGELRALL